MAKLNINKIRQISILISTASLLTLTGCAQDGKGLSKTAIGGMIGAVVGGVAGKNTGGKNDKSVAIGAVLGGLAGAGVGAYMDKQQKELEEKLAREQAEKKIEIERMANNVIKVNLDSNATFAVNKATLNPSFNQSLTKIADTLKGNDKTVIHIIGHTDSTGSDQLNQKLSEERATSVGNFLSTHGVSTERLRALGVGKNNPVASNNTEVGRQQNRRVEIYLKPIIEGQEQQAYISPVS